MQAAEKRTALSCSEAHNQESKGRLEALDEVRGGLLPHTTWGSIGGRISASVSLSLPSHFPLLDPPPPSPLGAPAVRPLVPVTPPPPTCPAPLRCDKYLSQAPPSHPPQTPPPLPQVRLQLGALSQAHEARQAQQVRGGEEKGKGGEPTDGRGGGVFQGHDASSPPRPSSPFSPPSLSSSPPRPRLTAATPSLTQPLLLPSQAQAHSSHSLSLGILGLTAALEAPGHRPLAPHVAALRAAAGGDEIVEAAVAALPATVRTR